MIGITDVETGSIYRTSATAQTTAAQKTDGTSESSTGSALDEIKLQYHQDRVEISDAGRASLSAQAQTTQKAQKDADSQSEDVQSQLTAAMGTMKTQEASLSGLSSEEESSTDSAGASSASTTAVLSTLTEQEMSDLVSDGTITQQQTNKELARRAAEEQAVGGQAAAVLQSMDG